MDRNQILLILVYSVFFIGTLSVAYTYYKRSITFPEAANLMILIILVIINVGYTDAVRKQLWVMVEQVRVMGKRTELSIEFESDNPAFITSTTIEDEDGLERGSRWLCLKIKNEGDYVAKNCQGRLEEVKNRKGETLYKCSPIILHWSSLPLKMPFMDIQGWWLLDVVYTVAGTSSLFIANTFGMLKAGKQDFLPPDIYIFIIRIYSENANVESIKLHIVWKGKWDELEASVIKNEEGNS